MRIDNDTPWVKIILVGIAAILLIGGGLWSCSGGRGEAQEEQPTPTRTPLPPIDDGPEEVIEAERQPLPTLSQAAVEATQQAQIAWSRPAFDPEQELPEAYRMLIGSINLDHTYVCPVTNIFFNASGTPYFLYIPPSFVLEQNPANQLLRVSGNVLDQAGCQFPVLIVSDMAFLNSETTPAPVAHIGGGLAYSVTVVAPPTVTVAPPVNRTPVYQPPVATATVSGTESISGPGYIPPAKTALPTYTPYPTYTPAQPEVAKVEVEVTRLVDMNTATPEPSRLVSLYGKIVLKDGCDETNFAIEEASGFVQYVILDSVSVPASPDGWYAYVSGIEEDDPAACRGEVIRARRVNWVEPTATPSPTATATPTATPAPITLMGDVEQVAGCAQSNFAIVSSGETYFLILSGATLPDGNPADYTALVTGQESSICGGGAVLAQQITWYEPTPGPEPTATATGTAGPEPTATATGTAGTEPTATATPEPPPPIDEEEMAPPLGEPLPDGGDPDPPVTVEPF